MTRFTRLVTAFVLTLTLFGGLAATATAQDHGGHGMAGCDATPAADYSGHDMGASTPAADHAGHTTDGTPAATAPASFDLTYIDMMIPHHQSVIALAETALPLLTDQRLLDMANAIVASQQAEVETLQQLRAANFPDAAPVDHTDHDVLHSAFPSLLTWDYPMDQWDALMDAEALVAQFCGAANPDLGFVQLVIPHHEMAILASQDALSMAQVPEIVTIAQNVITSQQSEVDLLTQIEAELA